jgi:beta-alanine degradation protein BauB
MNSEQADRGGELHPPDELRRALLSMAPLLALAETSSAQDASKMQPQSYRVVLENDKLRVIEYNSRPGLGVCGNGMHSHPAHLTVVLSNAKVRVRTPDGKMEERTDISLGTTFWSEAETHEVENISGRNIRSLIVELKAGKV